MCPLKQFETWFYDEAKLDLNQQKNERQLP